MLGCTPKSGDDRTRVVGKRWGVKDQNPSSHEAKTDHHLIAPLSPMEIPRPHTYNSVTNRYSRASMMQP